MASFCGRFHHSIPKSIIERSFGFPIHFCGRVRKSLQSFLRTVIETNFVIQSGGMAMKRIPHGTPPPDAHQQPAEKDESYRGDKKRLPEGYMPVEIHITS